MPDTHDVLVDAAEQIVRTRGLDALTIRSLAAATNYGKSTVHSAVGGIGALTDELRERASAELREVMRAELPTSDDDPEWRAGAFARLSEWIIANPHWAEACFLANGTPQAWSRPVATLLVGSLPSGWQQLDEADGAELADFSARTISAFIPMIIHVGDVRFGAQRLQSIFSTIHDALAELLEVRGVRAEAAPGGG